MPVSAVDPEGSPRRGMRNRLTAPSRWSVAGQTFALQVLVAALVVGAGLLGAYLQAQRSTTAQATARTTAVAEAVAATPDVIAAVQAPNPTATLQPYAERVRLETGTDFVVIMSTDGIRYTHPDASQIGQEFLGNIDRALAPDAFTETYTGTLGPSVRAVVPVFGDDGDVIALVAAGVTVSNTQVALGGRPTPVRDGWTARRARSRTESHESGRRRSSRGWPGHVPS